jgi:putative addiction module component (TIGR02574 family)
MTQFQAILAKALALDPDDRAALVETLRASLDTPEAIDRAWAAEIERRSAEFESGAVEAIPEETVLAEARALLKRPRR